jgi:hypothetical protein
MFANTSFGLTGRLYAGVAAVIIGLIGCAAYTAKEMNDIDTLATKTESLRVPQLQRMAALELNVTRASLQVRHAMLARTPEERAAALADVGKLKATVDGLAADFEKGLSTDGGRKRFAEIKPALETFWAVGTENMAKINEGKVPEAFAFLVERTIPPAMRCSLELPTP